MSFDPGNGETLATDEELESLTAAARAAVGDPVHKLDLFYLDQQVWSSVADQGVRDALAGTLAVDEILTGNFVRELHARL